MFNFTIDVKLQFSLCNFIILGYGLDVFFSWPVLESSGAPGRCDIILHVYSGQCMTRPLLLYFLSNMMI